jgi:hypothetical protein
MARSRYIATTALCAALVVALVLAGETLNARLSFAALAGLPVLIATRRYGLPKSSPVWFLPAGLLAAFGLIPGAILFGGIFGFYALCKPLIERLPLRLRIPVKLIWPAAVLGVFVFAFGHLLPEWLGNWKWFAYPVLMAAFVPYDRALGVLAAMIERKI